jgi:hypothetical protein
MREREDELTPAYLRTGQLIASCLILGVLVFLGIAVYLVQVQHQGTGMAPVANAPLMSYIAAGLLALMAPLSFLVPSALVRNSVQQIAGGTWHPSPQGPAPATDAGKLLLVRQTTMIIGMAQLEGACFFGGIAYLLEGQPLALVVVVIGLLLLMTKFPTEGRVRSWLDAQMEQLDLYREQG